MTYEKGIAEIIYFTNRDVITTSGAGEESGCRNRGQNTGIGCSGNSGNCPSKAWKE